MKQVERVIENLWNCNKPSEITSFKHLFLFISLLKIISEIREKMWKIDLLIWVRIHFDHCGWLTLYFFMSAVMLYGSCFPNVCTTCFREVSHITVFCCADDVTVLHWSLLLPSDWYWWKFCLFKRLHFYAMKYWKAGRYSKMAS